MTPPPCQPMRHLLTAAAGALLVGCSSDLVVKSDLGEQVVIKDSAVSVNEWDPSQSLETASKNVAEVNKSYSNCFNGVASLDQETCWRIYGDSYTMYQDIQAKIRSFINSKGKIVQVKYRPVYIDLNGKKTAPGEYETISCFPKSLTSGDLKISKMAAEAAILDIGEGSKDGSVAKSVYKEICGKYVK